MTVRVVEPVTAPETARIVVVPCNRAFARPAPLMVATFVLEELQVTEFVRFCVLPLVYVPVAVNCFVSPAAIAEFDGVTAIDTRVGAVTVKRVEPVTGPEAALIVVEPCATLVARPAPVMVATAVVVEVQVTELVRSFVLLSE